MANPGGLGFHLIFLVTLLVEATLTCFGVGNTTVVCTEKERLALLRFRHSVKDDYGMLSSWAGNDCCRWKGIHCDSITGTVESLHLRGGQSGSFVRSLAHNEGYYYYYDFVGEGYLVGTEVNSSLTELRHLKYLDLSGNHFQGSRIPEFIGSFNRLSYLNLSHAGFQGNIPPHIGNLSSLRVLDLSSNSELMADDMSWTFGFSSLEHLDLSFLDLSGVHNWDMVLYMNPWLKELRFSYCELSNAYLGPFLNSSRILPNIKHLDLGFNLFNGPFPGFLQNMTSLAFLDLSCSHFSFAWDFGNMLNLIPSLSELHLSCCGMDKTSLSPRYLNFSTLSNIQYLDLSRNSFEGIFPPILTNMSSLKVLDLSGNSLNSWVPIMPNLLKLDLSSNGFMQIEHVGIWRQCHLKELSVSYNFFDIERIDSPKNESECSKYALESLDSSDSGLTGPIPEFLRRLRLLEVLDLSYNQLTGPIPTFLGKLSKLNLSHNRFNGPITESFEKLSSLSNLNLGSNLLTGRIPTFVGKLSKLDLSFNLLNGSIPESFGKLTALTELYLEGNRLTGPIPTSIGRLASLQAISFSSNRLNGTIPISIGQLAKLHFLDISNNSLEGLVFEAHLDNLFMLKHLDTSSNTKLTFNVSREWMPLFQLITLRLSSCNIGNEFPQWIQNQKKLQMLVLSNASISGPLPVWLHKRPVIPYLDLSHNKLNGPLTNLQNRRDGDAFHYVYNHALFLENNLFNESIPRSLCTRTGLEYLNLSRNRLTGKIPNCLEDLQNLFIMVFSSNRLSGVIPSFLALSSSLVWLQLNDNKFTGELPTEFIKFRNLRVLDLGDNSLSGNIPKRIGENLTSLVVLRLHKNNFTGRIPQSLCKAVNLQILDVAYNFLTGTIPHCLGELNAMVKNSPVDLGSATLCSDKNVSQVMKGVDLEYTKTWDIVFNMDLSSNKLVGEIPVKLTTLSMLIGLNLSNNHLSGVIPDSIGNMRMLESLDFSKNELSGTIPPSMGALTFLNHLNLSHNNLSGRIPTGSQLQTLTDPSIYVGNKDLCGVPLPKNCSNQEGPVTTSKKKYMESDEPREVWFYLDVIGGFIMGFWGVIGVLLVKKQWRQELFMFAEEIMVKIYIAFVVRVAKMKRGREAASIPWNASNSRVYITNGYF